MLSNNVIHMFIEYMFFLIIPVLSIDVFCGLIMYFNRDKIKKKHLLIFICVFLIQIVLAQRFFFPTYWKYPDPLIDSDIVQYTDVEEIFGPFDKDELQYKAYYIYTDKDHNKHYYVIEVDTDKFVSIVYDAILD